MNVVRGMEFTADFPVFSSNRNFMGHVTVSGIVSRGLSYSTDNKHWIYFKITKSNDERVYKLGKEYRKQGKNFYPAVKDYKYPDDYNAKAAEKELYKLGRVRW